MLKFHSQLYVAEFFKLALTGILHLQWHHELYMWSAKEISPKVPACSQAVLGKFYEIQKGNQYNHELWNIKHEVNDNIELHQ